MANGNKPIHNFAFLFLLFLFIATFIGYIPGHRDDAGFWTFWCKAIYENKLSNIYNTHTNYLPFYHYILYIFSKITGNPENIVTHINYLRLFTLVFDCIGLWYVYNWINKKTSYIILTGLSILNIAYSYNSLIWGQVDGILATLTLISFYYLWRQQLLLACIFGVLAINMKLQAIVYLPLFGIYFLHQFLNKPGLWKFIGILVIIPLTQLLILFPFLSNEYAIPELKHIIFDADNTYQQVSLNAMNFWYLTTHADLYTMKDSELFIGGLSYKTTGLILYGSSYLLITLPLIAAVSRKLFQKTTVSISREKIMLMCALVALCFFYFNTQMHERYSHPAFIFITAYSFYTKKYFPYCIFSMAYLLNMEKVLKNFQLNNYDTLLFNPQLVSALFLSVIVYLFIKLYKPVNTIHSISE